MRVLIMLVSEPQIQIDGLALIVFRWGMVSKDLVFGAFLGTIFLILWIGRIGSGKRGLMCCTWRLLLRSWNHSFPSFDDRLLHPDWSMDTVKLVI